MAVLFYRHSWGAVGENAAWPDLGAFVEAAAAEGYDGVEVPFGDFGRGPAGPAATEAQFREAIQASGIPFFPLIQTGARPRSDVDGHLQHFRELVNRAREWGATAAAVHTGDDSFDDATSIHFFRDADQIARDVGLVPYFETHRGRPMYNPWRTATILEALPNLQITADFAHWIPVLERLPDDLDDILQLCAERTGHLHARVGHEEGGQVPHPRDPAWEAHVAWHEKWWDRCIEAAVDRDEDVAITPEFGPFSFLLNQPFTQTPLANLAEVVSWMTARLRERYQQ